MYLARVRSAWDLSAPQKHTDGQSDVTLPRGPKPTFKRVSTLSVTTLLRASASIPRIMIAPLRCGFGSGLSEPSNLKLSDAMAMLHSETYYKPAIVFE